MMRTAAADFSASTIAQIDLSETTVRAADVHISYSNRSTDSTAAAPQQLTPYMASFTVAIRHKQAIANSFSW